MKASDKKILEVHKLMNEAVTPEPRTLNIPSIKWWRHPIKRWKQHRAVKYLKTNQPN